MSSPRSRRRWAAGAASIAWHAAVLALLILAAPIPAPRPPSAPVAVELVAPPPVEPAAKPTPQPRPAPAKAAQAAPAAPTRAPAQPLPVRLAARDVPDAVPIGGATSNGLSDAELAGAAVAGSGPGGGSCDLARRIQAALRRDPLVRSALSQASADAGGRAVKVWDGDWVQSRGEDGKGLAAVREAIMWEVAFAPAPCRAEQVRGLILMSMADGGPRLALGAGQWRWSDLLRTR